MVIKVIDVPKMPVQDSCAYKYQDEHGDTAYHFDRAEALEARLKIALKLMDERFMWSDRQLAIIAALREGLT